MTRILASRGARTGTLKISDDRGVPFLTNWSCGYESKPMKVVLAKLVASRFEFDRVPSRMCMEYFECTHARSVTSLSLSRSKCKSRTAILIQRHYS